jgi:hypothetical protein
MGEIGDKMEKLRSCTVIRSTYHLLPVISAILGFSFTTYNIGVTNLPPKPSPCFTFQHRVIFRARRWGVDKEKKKKE